MRGQKVELQGYRQAPKVQEENKVDKKKSGTKESWVKKRSKTRWTSGVTQNQQRGIESGTMTRQTKKRTKMRKRPLGERVAHEIQRQWREEKRNRGRWAE